MSGGENGQTEGLPTGNKMQHLHIIPILNHGSVIIHFPDQASINLDNEHLKCEIL